jgi:hypothetical protein
MLLVIYCRPFTLLLSSLTFHLRPDPWQNSTGTIYAAADLLLSAAQTKNPNEVNKPRLNRYAPFPFLTLGLTFIAIGVSGQSTLMYVGIVFLILALVMFLKLRKSN